MFDRYKNLMFPVDPKVKKKTKNEQSPRAYKTKAVRKRRAARKIAYKSKRINRLVTHHKNKRG